MFVQSQNITLGEGFLAEVLAGLLTAPSSSFFSTPTLHLFTSVSGTITPLSTVNQFTEATFTGYAASVIASFSGSILLPSNQGYGAIAQKIFVAGAVTAPGQNVMGYWLDNGSTNFYAAEQFATPVPFTASGDFLDLAVVIGLLTPARVN